MLGFERRFEGTSDSIAGSPPHNLPTPIPARTCMHEHPKRYAGQSYREAPPFFEPEPVKKHGGGEYPSTTSRVNGSFIRTTDWRMPFRPKIPLPGGVLLRSSRPNGRSPPSATPVAADHVRRRAATRKAAAKMAHRASPRGSGTAMAEIATSLPPNNSFWLASAP